LVMAELRQNIATHEWVIIADGRAERPTVYAEAGRQPTVDRATWEPGCAFCPGNEEDALEVSRSPGERWRTRLVRNKFPALAVDGALLRRYEGVERRLSGVGYHEVLVAHRHHDTTLALMTAREVRNVLLALQKRGRELAQDERVEYLVYFKNHGPRAGASVAHPHCQLISLPVVPGEVRRRLETATHYFDEHGCCVYCFMLDGEQSQQQRVVGQHPLAAAFVLFAAQSPFHVWVMPRHHRASFLEATREELAGVAEVLRQVLRQLYDGLHDPDFNLMIRSVPVRERAWAYFHWYVSIVPRFSRTAGFEMGSGIRICPAIPEECAEFLRSVPAPTRG